MAETKIATGSRDDVRIDPSRCLRMRFSESSCRLCTTICPHAAITLKGGLSIHPGHCRGCLLCTAVCPAGALEQENDFSACLAQLSRVPHPVLGCIRTSESSNAAMACLGALTAEHLLALCHTLPDQVALNLTACGDCPNSPILPHLHQRLTCFTEAGLSGNSGGIVITESAHDIRYCAESVDRRSFFKSFRNSLFQSAVAMLSSNTEQTVRRSGYGEKRVPLRREMLNRTRIKLSQELETLVEKHLDSQVSFDESCRKCQGCAAICPTGALQSKLPKTPPVFEQQLCTGCGLCREFCLEGALRISEVGDEEEAG